MLRRRHQHSREDPFKRVPLRRIGAVVDQEAKFAILLHYVALPMADEDNGQVFGKVEVAVMAVPDQPSQDALAKSVCRVRPEIARAADSAVAQVPPISSRSSSAARRECLHRQAAPAGPRV
jgi:hypothetical protein